MGGGGFSEAVSPVHRDVDVNVKPKLVQVLDCTCPLDEYIAETVHSTSRSNLKRLWEPSEIERMRQCPKHAKAL